MDLDESRDIGLEEGRAVRTLIEQIHAFKRKNQRFRGNLAGAGKPKPIMSKSQDTPNSNTAPN